VAEFEREILREPVKAGMAQARRTGKRRTSTDAAAVVAESTKRKTMVEHMDGSNFFPRRKIFRRVSILVGNSVQIAGLVAAYLALAAARSAHWVSAAVFAMVVGWILLYFCCHAIAHWVIGRLVGIRFAFYTVGGTGNPEGWPTGLRWLFEHLPFLGVQTEKASMQRASPIARAIMWSAGVTSSAVVPTLGALWAWRSGVPWSKWFFLFALFWAVGTLASNWTSRTGDYSKARYALGNS
jgi:hypothetical protein